jgi:hypothetical protein
MYPNYYSCVDEHGDDGCVATGTYNLVCTNTASGAIHDGTDCDALEIPIGESIAELSCGEFAGMEECASPLGNQCSCMPEHDNEINFESCAGTYETFCSDIFYSIADCPAVYGCEFLPPFIENVWVSRTFGQAGCEEICISQGDYCYQPDYGDGICRLDGAEQPAEDGQCMDYVDGADGDT